MNSSSMCTPFPRTVISVSAPSSSARIASAGGIRTSTRERPVHRAFHQSALVTLPGPVGHGHRRAGGLVPPQHAPPAPGRSENPAVILDRRNSFIYQTGRRRSIASMGPRTDPADRDCSSVSRTGLYRLRPGSRQRSAGSRRAFRSAPRPPPCSVERRGRWPPNRLSGLPGSCRSGRCPGRGRTRGPRPRSPNRRPSSSRGDRGPC